MTPENEMGVIVFFSQSIISMPIKIISIGAAFPDAVIEVKGQVLRVEFEYVASNFLRHGHDVRDCDLIVCWSNDLPDDFVLPIWALSRPNWLPSVESIKLPDKSIREIFYWKERAKSLESALNVARKEIDDLRDSSNRKQRQDPSLPSKKELRQKALIEIFDQNGYQNNQNSWTFVSLAGMLYKQGYKCTARTVSNDVKELGLAD